MTARDVLKIADQRNIQFKVSGHEIRFDAPDGTMDDEFIRHIKKHKAHLLLLLDKNTPIWCGTNCEHGQRREVEGLPVLCCQVSDQAVIDIQACPLGHWAKDPKGRPHNVDARND